MQTHRIAAILAGLAALGGAVAAEAPSRSADPGRPFPPSYITTDTGKVLEPEDWQDPIVCSGCHPRQFKGWQGSMHSIAFEDPVFQAEWALAEKEMGGELMNHCGGCHTPIGVATQTIAFDAGAGEHGGFTAPAVAAQGVSCDVCHTISDSNLQKTAVLEHGNASFVVSPGNVKRGPLRDAKSPFHNAVFSEHHTKAELCGNCHNIFHPTNNFPVERTYDEWKYSVYAQHDIQCQDCHMVPVETAIKVADTLTRPKDMPDAGLGGSAGMGGKQRSLVHDHGFVGGNATVAPLLGVQGAEEHRAEAIRRLHNVAELDVELTRDGDNLHHLAVKVTNARAGHHLPTSLTHIRELWLEVAVTDDKGRELLRSGTLDDHNHLPEGTVVFDNKAVDKNGKPTHKPWRIVRFEELNTIPPKGHRYGRYAFNVPDSSTALKVVAKLHYRSFSQAVADKLLGQGAVRVPSVQMEMVVREYAAADLAAR